MNKFRILIAEDESNWQDQLLKKALSLDAEVEIAATYEGASQIIKEQYLDLALIDLSLPSGKLNIPASQSPLLGINLLGDIRKQGPRNQHIGVVVISGMVDVLLTDKLKGEFDVFKVIDKAEGLPDNFLNILQSAILAGWLDRSDFLNTSRCRLTVSFSKDYLLSSELQGADRIVTSTSENPQRIDVNDLVRRADILNWMISNGGTDIWRPEAKSIGKAIYETITAHRHV